MKRKALVFVLSVLGCVAIAGGGRAVAGESGRGVLQRGVAAQEVVDVVNFTAEPLFVVGETRITGAGGLRLPSLSLGAKSRLVIDPVRTPIFVASAPSFAPGAKIALAERYAGVKRGRIVLATWGGNADIPDGLFDAASVIGKAVVAVETAPDGKSRQLVATIGDYDSSPELRIVALGDSITQGIQKPEQKESGFPQYRTSLAALLAANGVKAQMLGTRTHSQLDAAGVQAPKEWTGHFGWSGITTGGLLGKKSNWVADGEVPDVVTMLIGTNDINHKKRDIKDKGKSSEKAASEIYKSWKKLVDAVAARWPDAKIICGTILDRDFYDEGPIGHELAVAVNDLIRADCKAGRLPKNFVLVDLYGKCPLAEEGVFFKDKLHPNWKGHMLMAEAFFDAIRSSPGTAAADLKK